MFLRWIFNGNAPPVLNGGSPFPATQFFQKYLNLFLFPHMMDPTRLKTTLGMSHEQLYDWRERYTIPFLSTPGPGGTARHPHILTPDSMTGLLLRKLHSGLPDIDIGAEYGMTGKRANETFNNLLAYIYQNDERLNALRNLSNEE